MREEVPLDVEKLGVIDERSDRGRRQMRLLKLLRDAEGRDERASMPHISAHLRMADGEYTPVVAGDHDGTCPRLLALLDLVDLVEALALVRLLQLLRELVIPDGAGVHD